MRRRPFKTITFLILHMSIKTIHRPHYIIDPPSRLLEDEIIIFACEQLRVFEGNSVLFLSCS